MLDQRRELGQHPVEGVVALSHDGQQSIGGIDGVGDVVTLLVQLIGERVQPIQELMDLIGAAGQQVVELGLDGLQVLDATTVQDRRDTRQHPFGGRERRAVLQRDGVAVAQQLRRRIRRRVQLHVLAAQQAGLTDLGQRVLRQLDVGLQIERQRRDPVLQLDRADPSDKHVGHPHAAVDVERQRIRHLHVDRHLVRSGARAAGQRNVRDALPRPARAQHQRDHHERERAAGDTAPLTHAHHPPASAGRAGPAGAAGAGPDSGDPPGSPGITPGAGTGGGPGCTYHGGGSGLFSL